MYHQVFEQEDAMQFFRLTQRNLLKAVAGSNIIHYMRESFVLFLKLVRDRLGISEERWLEVMDRFFSFKDADKSLPIDMNNYQDLCAHLHCHGDPEYSSQEVDGARDGIGWHSAVAVLYLW
jgi:hypothetical protein